MIFEFLQILMDYGQEVSEWVSEHSDQIWSWLERGVVVGTIIEWIKEILHIK